MLDGVVGAEVVVAYRVGLRFARERLAEPGDDHADAIGGEGLGRGERVGEFLPGMKRLTARRANGRRMNRSASQRLREARSRILRGIDICEIGQPPVEKSKDAVIARAGLAQAFDLPQLAPMPAPSSPRTPLWSGSPSQWLNFGSFTLCLLTSAALAFVAIHWHVPLVATGIAIPVAIAFWKWLKVRSLKIEVTSQRISTQVGVLSRHREDMELYRVKDTTLHEPFLLRLVGRANISSDRRTARRRT